MTIIYLFLLAIILVVYAVFALVSNNFHEKIIIFTQMSSIVTLFISMLASIKAYEFYIDIAILYSLFSFISMKALIFYNNSRVR